MLIKNLSKGIFNLASGELEPGQEGEATLKECKVLFPGNMAEPVSDMPDRAKNHIKDVKDTEKFKAAEVIKKAEDLKKAEK